MRSHHHQFVAGQWQPAQGSAVVLQNPATEEPHASVRLATIETANAAVTAARLAAPGWAGTAPWDRAQFITSIGTALRRRIDELTRSMAIEIGTPLGDARRLQVELALRAFEYAPTLAIEVAKLENIGNTQIRRAPIGVATCITPWNYPLYQIATKIVPALVAGVPVVLKPSEVAPLAAFTLCECAVEAGLPAGTLNVVVGGPDIGRHLIAHEGIDVISFTGSTTTGREVAASAGRALKKVSLELGGKSASIVLDDADLTAAVRGTLDKCFQNAGQTCAALTRLLVPRRQLRNAAEIAQSLAATYRLGDPFDPEVRMGPLISGPHRDRVLRMIQTAIDQGATLLSGGVNRPSGHPRGHFVLPTVLIVESPILQIVQEEVFGPVLTLQPYDSESDALAIANGTPFGLSGAIWSTDVSRAQGVARKIRAGSVSINGASTHPEAPFGGFGASGFGRERGRWGLDTYTTTQALHQ